MCAASHFRIRAASSVAPAQLDQLFAIAETRHRFAGAALAGDPPVLLFALDSAKDAREVSIAAEAKSIGKPPIMPLTWGWDTEFGGALTITLFAMGNTGGVARVYVARNDPAFADLRDGKFLGVVCHGRKVALVLDFDLSEFTPEVSAEGQALGSSAMASFDGGAGQFRTQWERVDAHQSILEDPRAAYWKQLPHSRNLGGMLSRADRLSIGWARRYSKLLTLAELILSSACQTNVFEPPKENAFSSLQREWLDVLRDGGSNVAAALQHLAALQDRDPDLIFELLVHPGKDFIEFANNSADGIVAAVHEGFLQLHLIRSEGSRCGRKVPVFRDDRSIGSLALRPNEFPQGADPEEYWERLPSLPVFNWDRFVRGTDFPVRCDQAFWDQLPLAEDVRSANEAAETLLAEAVAEKQWTIPPHAIVELPVGPFRRFEVLERYKNIFFVGRTANDRFLVICVEPEKRYVALDCLGHWPKSERQCRRIHAALKLLVASIVRDFWVVEDRETVFTERSRRIGPRPRRDGESQASVVYLPRVRYTNKPDVKRCEEHLDQKRRKAHWVRPFLRKSEHASEEQVFLAQRYGLDVPQGYTFVRPHQRGKREKETIYKSRSAMRALFTVANEVASSGTPRWFKFEKDVQNLLKDLGFETQHVASNKRGDRGIDVYATKGTDLDEVRWVIQCKCYSLKRRVGPSVIRDLLGALGEHAQGTRGMVVTTSGFTSGAIDLAEASNIRLIDGAEFASLLADRARSGESANRDPRLSER